VIAALLFASAMIVPTRCQTAIVPVPYDPQGARTLLACDGSFPDDVLWNLDRADQLSGDLDGRFNRRIDGTGSVIYVIDSGVLAAHDEFASAEGSRVIGGVDLLANEPGGEMPCQGDWAVAPCTNFQGGVMIEGHGTAVASAAAGNRVGVAPGAKLVSIRALGFLNFTPKRMNDALDAVIRHAWDPSAPPFRTGIVTMSFGLNQVDPNLEAKIRVMIGGVDRDGNPDPNGKRFFFTFFGGNAGEGHCDDAGNLLVFPSNRGDGGRAGARQPSVERRLPGSRHRGARARAGRPGRLHHRPRSLPPTLPRQRHVVRGTLRRRHRRADAAAEPEPHPCRDRGAAGGVAVASGRGRSGAGVPPSAGAGAPARGCALTRLRRRCDQIAVPLTVNTTRLIHDTKARIRTATPANCPVWRARVTTRSRNAPLARRKSSTRSTAPLWASR
jgi:hypothetical protein